MQQNHFEKIYSGSIKEVIEDIIRLNYKQNSFNVSQLADTLRICSSHLGEVVYFNFGVNAQKLIETIRIENAIKLMYQGRSIMYTAKDVGYLNTQTFRRAFKRRLHITPSDFQHIIEKYPRNRGKIAEKFKKLL